MWPYDPAHRLVAWLDTGSVIPAKAGIKPALPWIPAFAGKTMERRIWGGERSKT